MHSKNLHVESSGNAEFMRQLRSTPLFWLGELWLGEFRLGALLLAVLWLPLVHSNASAEEKTQAESLSDENSKPGALSKAGSLVDDAHSKISDRFSRFVVQIDDFIGAGESVEQLNTSWARIRVELVKPGAEDLKFAAKVKLRVVLPQSEQRFRLLVSSDDDEDKSSAANSDAAQRGQIASEDTNNVALALRFIRTARDRFRLNYDLGARFKDDRAQLFGRFIVGYKKDWILGFTNTFTNRLTYFSASGYQNSFRIDTHRTFFDRESLYFRNTIELSSREGDSGVGIGETMGFYADLGKRRALALEGITGYATSLNEGIEDKYRGVELRIRYRQNIWRPWLYYEIWPSVSWSSSNDYERAYGGLFRVEVTIGNV